MSYYYPQNNKQRSVGFVVVVVLHIVLIYGLVNCFTVIEKAKIIEAIKADVIDIVPPKVEVPPPEEPTEIKRSIPDFVPPSNLNFEVDAAPTNTAIKQVQHESATIDLNPSFVKARRSSKGLTHPKYPEDAAKRGEEGVTELNLKIAASGDVVEALVISTSGSNSLDRSIVTHALRYWKFTPCMDEGTPVPCWHPFTFHWNIENAKKTGTWRSVVAAKNE